MRDGVEFRVAYIGADFRAERSGPFDPAFMRALFAFDLTPSGDPWVMRDLAHGLARPAG